MAVWATIQINIVSEGKELVEYRDPQEGSTPSSDAKQTRYIEATTGAKFSVDVKLLPGFQLSNADGVQYRILIDNDKGGYFGGFAGHELSAEEGKVVMPHSSSTDGSIFQDAQTKKWHSWKFSFGGVAISECRNFQGLPTTEF